MDVTKYKKDLENLAKRINDWNLGEEIQVGFQEREVKNMRLYSANLGSLWVMIRNSGFSIGLRLKPIERQETMFSKMMAYLGRGPDGYYHPKKKQPFWNVEYWSDVEVAAHYLIGLGTEDFNPELYPDEAETKLLPEKYPEGAILNVRVNRFERDRRARERCIEFHGVCCSVCDIDFESKYGEIGRNFIHIHHLKELSILRAETHTCPKKDLIPVCPNCHAMLHREKPALTPSELKQRMNNKKV